MTPIAMQTTRRKPVFHCSGIRQFLTLGNGFRKLRVFLMILAGLFHAAAVTGQEWTQGWFEDFSVAHPWGENSFVVHWKNIWLHWDIVDNRIRDLGVPPGAFLLGLDKDALVFHVYQEKKDIVVFKSGEWFICKYQGDEGYPKNVMGWRTAPVKIKHKTYWLTLNFKAGKSANDTVLYLRDHKTFQIIYKIPFHHPILDKYMQISPPVLPHLFTYDVCGTSFGKFLLYIRCADQRTPTSLSAYTLNLNEKKADCLWTISAKDLNGWQGGCEFKREYLWADTNHDEVHKICLRTGKIMKSAHVKWPAIPSCFMIQDRPYVLVDVSRGEDGEKSDEKYTLLDMESGEKTQTFIIPAAQVPCEPEGYDVNVSVRIYQGTMYLCRCTHAFVFDISSGKLLRVQSIISPSPETP